MINDEILILALQAHLEFVIKRVFLVLDESQGCCSDVYLIEGVRNLLILSSHYFQVNFLLLYDQLQVNVCHCTDLTIFFLCGIECVCIKVGIIAGKCKINHCVKVDQVKVFECLHYHYVLLCLCFEHMHDPLLIADKNHISSQLPLAFLKNSNASILKKQHHELSFPFNLTLFSSNQPSSTYVALQILFLSQLIKRHQIINIIPHPISFPLPSLQQYFCEQATCDQLSIYIQTMASQDWKSILVTFVLSAIILTYFVGTTVQNRAFEISKNHLKYHANWTSKFEDLDHVDQLQEAYKLNAIQSIDLAFSMSSLDLASVTKLLPTQFKQYKSIKINLANNPIGTNGADYVLSLIPNGVEELDIAFDSIQADLELGSVLAKRLNNLNSLKKLKLSLILSIKNDTVVDDYLRYGRLGQHLENYSLVLIGNGLTAKSLGFLETHLQRANLKTLDLNLYANKIGAEGAEIVAKAIKSQKNLNTLGLDLYFNNVTEVGTQAICDSIDEIKNDKLKTLNLNLDFNYIKNQGAKALGTLLSRLQSVESLNLGVASKNFGYLGFKYIVNGLTHLPQLKELAFRCGINRVGGNGAEITRDLLYKLPNLVTLSLNFYENYVGDEGIVELTKAAASLQHLERLSLNYGFNDAKGYGLIRALESLVKRSYKELYISFSSNEFQDTEVNLVLDELQRIIQKTKVFEFEFMETAISKAYQIKLEKLFKGAKALGNKATIHVNSVISEEQEKKYQGEAKEREEKLKEIEKKLGEQQREVKAAEAVNAAEEKIELDQETAPKAEL